MELTRTSTPLRSRLIAKASERETALEGAAPATVDDDPFAGEDALWAPEDWTGGPSLDESQRFFSGLIVGIVFSAVGWLVLATAATIVYGLAT